MPNAADKPNAAAGLAALSICESLLIALLDLEVMSGNDVSDLLEDAVPSRSPRNPRHDGAVHRSAGALIAGIAASVKSAGPPLHRPI